MTPGNMSSSDSPEPSPPSDRLPADEDAYVLDDSPEEAVEEDDLQLLGPAARSLEGDAANGGATEELPATSTSDLAATVADKDDTSDAEAVADEPDTLTNVADKPELPDWDNEMSAHKIAVELKRLESEIRELLVGHDTKRKRKLAGTRRWLELEEDIITWRFTGRGDEPGLIRLHDLVTRRHHLFKRLRFLAGTRPRWNT